MKKVKLMALLGFLPLVCIFFSCNKETVGHQDSNQDAPKEVNNEEQVESNIPDSGVLVFDISHSTRGYLNSSSSIFRGVVAQMGRQLNVNDYYLYGETERRISKEAFIDTLNTGKFRWAQESNLISMVGFMVKRVKSSNNIACLISDGIISGTNEQILNNAEYNIQNREVLQSLLEGVLDNLDTTYSALVTRYLAPFKGTYYCYNNKHVQINSTQRPYFAIIIGKCDKVKELEKNLTHGKADGKEDSFYKYTDLVMFGDNNTFKNIKFTPNAPNAGCEKISGSSYRVTNKESVSFRCEIKDLPSYMQTEEYFAQNFYIEKKRSEQIEKKFSEQTDYTVIPRDKYNLTIDNDRHRVLVTFSENPSVYISNNILHFKLKYMTPGWIAKYSDKDDLHIDTQIFKQQNQTFNLQYLLNSFKVLNFDQEYAINTSMEFKKQ